MTLNQTPPHENFLRTPLDAMNKSVEELKNLDKLQEKS